MSEELVSHPAEVQVAIVTGGSRGIGFAVVKALLDRGFKVHFCGLTATGVDTALDKLAPYGAHASGRAVDVGDQEKVDAFVGDVLEIDGRVDVLVNNAGIGYFAPVDEISGDDWRRLQRTNLDGPFYFMRAVAPAMQEAGQGFIFNVGSLAGRHAMAGGAAYNASKFGLVGLTEAAMLDLRSFGVRVAAILPGSVATGFGRETDDDRWKLQPDDIARTIIDMLDFPSHALPSVVELRPTHTAKTWRSRTT